MYKSIKIFSITILLLLATVYCSAQPIVNIRVARYERELRFVMTENGIWTTGHKTDQIPKGVECTLTGKLKEKAKKVYHVMIGSADLFDKVKLQEIEDKFEKLDYKTHRFQLGENRKSLPDTRRIFVGVGKYNTKEEAEKMLSKLSAKAISSWVFEEVVSLAKGTFVLKIGNRIAVPECESIDVIPETTIKLKKVEYARGYSWHGYEDRFYHGALAVKWSADDDVNCVLETDLESMLAGIVPSEISPKAPIEALRAQAIAARGEILSKIGTRHFREGFDFCSEQHCQVYKGLKPYVLDVSKKIKSTYGLLLENGSGKVIDAVYSGNCGGHTSSNDKIWTSNKNPQLQGVWDTIGSCTLDLTNENDVTQFIKNPPKCYCGSKGIEGSKKFRWTKAINATDWKNVEKSIGLGQISFIGNFRREVSGRIISLKVKGTEGEKVILKELPIRRLFLGLRSSCFIVDWKKNKKGQIRGASFSGAGWGHGVGMCQTGAQSMARSGATFREILLHYFTGAVINKIY